jgi:hypothetical protein
LDIQKHEARHLPSPLELCTLKRRKRRAPVSLNAYHPIAWLSKVSQVALFRPLSNRPGTGPGVHFSVSLNPSKTPHRKPSSSLKFFPATAPLERGVYAALTSYAARPLHIEAA